MLDDREYIVQQQQEFPTSMNAALARASRKSGYILMKEPFWNKSRRAIVPVDNRPFQMLRSLEEWQSIIDQAGLKIMRFFIS